MNTITSLISGVLSRPMARNADPFTSHVAARKAVKLAGSHQERIIGVLALPLTIDEIAEATGLSNVQVARRMPELQRQGIAEPTGDIGFSRSHRQERVWRLK